MARQPIAERYLTWDHALVRQMNLAAILYRLQAHAPVSRAELAAASGLNKTTVSSLIQELIERGYVLETGLRANGTGRPATLLRLNPDAGFVLAVELGVDFVTVVRASFAAEKMWRRQITTRPIHGQAECVEQTLDLVDEACRPTTGPGVPLLGIAVGVPGLVEYDAGRLLFAPNLGWRDVPLGSLLRERFGSPVLVDNEANLAALGEHTFGVAQGHDNVLYLSVGQGVGGGLIQDGRIYRGATGHAGELGHMAILSASERCGCGNVGCWETQVSLGALHRYFREAGGSSPANRSGAGLTEFGSQTLHVLAQRARSGDPAAVAAFARLGGALGVGIASLTNALNPDLVVLGGTLSAAGDLLVPFIECELRARALSWTADATGIAVALHGPDACVMGGIAAVLQSVLARLAKGDRLHARLPDESHRAAPVAQATSAVTLR
jgi:glucokinase-like ROK family protein